MCLDSRHLSVNAFNGLVCGVIVEHFFVKVCPSDQKNETIDIRRPMVVTAPSKRDKILYPRDRMTYPRANGCKDAMEEGQK